MRCPYCGNHETDVLETRDGDGAMRRRRECRKCGKRFTTFERVETIELYIIKKDGRREKFNREKLAMGMIKACEKRPVARDLIESLVDEIEQELRSKDTVEISSRTMGNLVLKKLRKVDKVAYLRFASVYLDFESLSDFEKVIEKLT